MWDRRVMEKIEEHVGELTMACSFRNVKMASHFAGVYGLSDYYRRYLWEELVSLISWNGTCLDALMRATRKLQMICH
jgi:hypothetical protein